MYFGFRISGLKDPVKVYEEIEDEARKVIMASGGSLSHHHGVGKIRKKFMPAVIGEGGLKMLKGIKEYVDPLNIFATNNIIENDTEETNE